MAETKYIIFALGEQRYGLRLSKINGIEQLYNVVPIPMGAAHIKGIIHLRNEVIPIYDIKEHFGIAEEPAVCNRQMLIAETHDLYIGFEVDDVLGIVSIPGEDVKDVPTVVRSEETEYLENIIKVRLPETGETDIMISISVDRIMSESDFDKVTNVLEETQGAE